MCTSHVHSILDKSVEAWTRPNVLEQNLMLTSKEKIFKKENIKNSLGNLRGTKSFSVLVSFCLKQIIIIIIIIIIKRKRHLLPSALSIDRVRKVIRNPKQQRKKSSSPPVGVPFLFCYRHTTIPATSINDCNVADSFNA